jgi:hypothetical protein
LIRKIHALQKAKAERFKARRLKSKPNVKVRPKAFDFGRESLSFGLASFSLLPSVVFTFVFHFVNVAPSQP